MLQEDQWRFCLPGTYHPSAKGTHPGYQPMELHPSEAASPPVIRAGETIVQARMGSIEPQTQWSANDWLSHSSINSWQQLHHHPHHQQQQQQQQQQQGLQQDPIWASAFSNHFIVHPQVPANIVRRNERERNRVMTINSTFSKLRQHLPTSSKSRKLSKVQILRSAIQYIHQLEDILKDSDESDDKHSEGDQSSNHASDYSVHLKHSIDSSDKCVFSPESPSSFPTEDNQSHTSTPSIHAETHRNEVSRDFDCSSDDAFLETNCTAGREQKYVVIEEFGTDLFMH